MILFIINYNEISVILTLHTIFNYDISSHVLNIPLCFSKFTTYFFVISVFDCENGLNSQ